MKLSELFENKKINENEQQRMKLEDLLHDMFMKRPYFEYVSRNGPEKVLDAIEHVAGEHKDEPEPDMNIMAQEVVGILTGKIRPGSAAMRR